MILENILNQGNKDNKDEELSPDLAEILKCAYQ